jgi:hypothetical protein
MQSTWSKPWEWRPVFLLEPTFGGPRYTQLARVAGQVRPRLGGIIIGNANATAAGGEVTEMLRSLAGYVDDPDIPISYW